MDAMQDRMQSPADKFVARAGRRGIGRSLVACASGSRSWASLSHATWLNALLSSMPCSIIDLPLTSPLLACARLPSGCPPMAARALVVCRSTGWHRSSWATRVLIARLSLSCKLHAFLKESGIPLKVMCIKSCACLTYKGTAFFR